MLSRLYARAMFAWETSLTTRDTNRIVRPLEWGFDWLPAAPDDATDVASDGEARMIALSRQISENSTEFFNYKTPTDFRLESRHPELFPTNVRPETLAQDADLKRKAAAGELASAEFLRFTSPASTPYPENDQMNARWFPASAEQEEKFRRAGKPRQAMIVMPQWNADAFSHNALCEIFNRFGISCLRLSKPYHDIRRPAELERSDYAVSANIGRTMASCRQAVIDIRCCLDWLEQQGYEQFGVLGTSLGSCYGFIAAAHDARIKVCAFNHAASWFGDVIWTGQSTRHIRAAFETAGLTQTTLREVFRGVSPMAYMGKFAANPRQVLVVYGKYDLTFLEEFSLEILASFKEHNIDYRARVLPCGHYTTGETPFKYIDAWYLGSFIHSAFKKLGFAAATPQAPPAEPQRQSRTAPTP
jgi:Alpha/beta hydrolase domain containing 18